MILQIRGADASMTEELEELGAVFSHRDRTSDDPFTIMAAEGATLSRLRLWVDPYDEDGAPYLGGTNDLERTIRLARRSREAGLDVMLDIHYSDFWTDPKKQRLPRAWSELDESELAGAVEDYTLTVMRRFADEGIEVAYVQVGNEITNGMLWPVGRTPRYLFEERRFEDVDPDERRRQFDTLSCLLAAGARAVRAESPDTRIILHLDFGGAADLYRGWFDEITARGVDFDVIGLSYYPIWHGTLDDLGRNLASLVERFEKDLCVVETAYAHRPDTADGAFAIFDAESAVNLGYPATVDGQRHFLEDLSTTLARVPDHRGLGFVYWEPAWIPIEGTSWASRAGMEYGDDVAEPGNNWSNQALFDEDGRALDSWAAFRHETPAARGRGGPQRELRQEGDER